MNRGVEIDSDVADDLSVSLIQDQVEMGVAARMAVLTSLAARLEQRPMSAAPLAFTNVRLVDPASGYDGPGALLVTEGVIADVVKGADARLARQGRRGRRRPGRAAAARPDRHPGQDRRAGRRAQGDAEVGARAAAAGGVTSIVVQPDTHPVIDEPSVVDFILRRARDIELVNVYPAGAATKGCEGERMAEIGLMHEAGCRLCHRRRPADRGLQGHAPGAGLRQGASACWWPTARPTPGSRRARRPREGEFAGAHGPAQRPGHRRDGSCWSATWRWWS